VSIVVPRGIYIDASTSSVNHEDATRLANACQQMSAFNGMETIGIISYNTLTNPTLANIKTRVQNITSDNFAGYNTGGTDTGRYLSQVFGELRYADSELGSYYDTAECAYAGLVSSLVSHFSPLNRPMYGSSGLKFNLSPRQMDALTGKQIVTFVNKPNRGVVVVDAPTAALPNSDYRRLTTVRIVQESIRRVRAVSEPFLGSPLDLPSLNTLTNRIQSALEDMKGGGALVDFNFSLTQSPEERVAGLLRVVLTLVPSFEIRRIRVEVSLRATL
jgi:hypothetical protein